ncbi:hypothetical protein J3998_10755 [Thiomicrorhabdus sp. 6S2-11]|uniref:Uncharacterized protein n=1 Tax=Thiomicrorhabdus marina TaxID=2818442 RepID=A0ABS3Q6S4_9GAMM|nr:hypothetical protein [Thiomicrorhabdus marina]MBO1928055.1 hypothetical protein [Thiomicrorhabdus marina]
MQLEALSIPLLFKEIASAAAIAITIIAFAPYIRAILIGKVQPHVFSWIIWGTTTFVVFLAQLQDSGGVGAWAIGVSGVMTIFIAFLAYWKRSDLTITRIDWLFFALAMTALPIWGITDNPMWAVIVLTFVDLLGFAPTVRKSYAQPYSESLLFFTLFLLRNLLVLTALENYSLTTVLFPAVIGVACLFFIAMIVYRRRIISPSYY